MIRLISGILRAFGALTQLGGTMNPKGAFILDRSVLTPLGSGVAANVHGMLNGSSAISNTDFERYGADFPVPYCGEIDWASMGLDLSGSELRSHFALRHLIDQIRSLTKLKKLDKMFCLIGGISLTDLDQLISSGRIGLSRSLSYYQFSNFSAFLSSQLKFRGLNIHRKDIVMIDNTCTSGNCVLGFAAQGIFVEEWETALVIALDLVDPFTLVALNGLGALSKSAQTPAKASRPFDRNRDGFVKSDGVGMALVCNSKVLQELSSPVQPIEILGFSQTSDAFRLTDGRDDVEAVLKAMNLAIERAGLAIKDIDVLKAHGTGTQLNDRHEAHAIEKLFYESGHRVPITSLKGHLGHVTDASGLVESLILGEALCRNVITPILNCDEPEFELDFVRENRSLFGPKVLMCNAIGFGGNNSSLVLRC